MDKLNLADAGFHGARPVPIQASLRPPFADEVARAVVALNALRQQIDLGGPGLLDQADSLADSLSQVDAALGQAVVALHRALEVDPRD